MSNMDRILARELAAIDADVKSLGERLTNVEAQLATPSSPPSWTAP